jgi:aryl-alcohol dehydrogenase-like predicted oxidoreductase
MSTFALGPMQVRRSGYGAMQLAGLYAFRPPPAQVALRWLLQLAPNVLLIPGTGAVAHLRENLAAERVVLDDDTLLDLDGVGA